LGQLVIFDYSLTIKMHEYILNVSSATYLIFVALISFEIYSVTTIILACRHTQKQETIFEKDKLNIHKIL